LATTAFVQAALQALYPVGSIYINAGVTTNPATLLGFGTWVAFGAGRVMVGLDGGDALFDALEETGGSKDATVISHSHTASSSSSSSFSGNALPGHQHTIGTGTGGASFGFGNTGVADTTTTTSSVSAGTPSGSVSTSTSTTVNSTGSSGTNANLQPYITVAMWKRTA
jgi:microcystin-dependent protein